MARRRVITLQLAKDDIDAIAIYLAKEAGIELAMRFFQAADETFEYLLGMPGMGKSVLFGKAEVKKAQQWRISDFESYLVFHRTEPSGITILRVLHGSRDINVELLES